MPRPSLLVFAAALGLVTLATADGTPTAPGAATAAPGAIHLAPDTTPDALTGGTPDPRLPTWQVGPDVLVIDRRSAAARAATAQVPAALAAPGTRELLPRHDASAFFLVGPRPGARPRHDVADLSRLGHVHLRTGRTAVVEVPRARLDAFLRAGLDLQHLDRSPLTPRTAAPAPPDRAATTPTPTTADPAAKAALLDDLDQQAFDQLIRELSGDTPIWNQGQPSTIATRFYRTTGNDLATDHLAQKLAGWGYAVELDTFSVWGTTCRNVVATAPGSVTPQEVVVVGGHFDSTSPQADSLAPGAEDNASGTSLVMELARAAAGREFERTVQFVLFDAEEVGLLGSQHFVDQAVAEGRQIIAAITADMVAYYNDDYGVLIEGDEPWDWLMSTMTQNAESHTDLAVRTSYDSWGSDHVPFQQAGIAAFLAIDWDWNEYPYYHTVDDTWQQIQTTSAQGLQIARAAAGTLADVAGLLGGTTPAPDTLPQTAATLHLTASPNPFNPRVQLSFALDRPASGELAVFDLRGRKVATLARHAWSAGEHAVTWDGEDASGRAVPSGVYVVRLVAGEMAVTERVTLAR